MNTSKSSWCYFRRAALLLVVSLMVGGCSSYGARQQYTGQSEFVSASAAFDAVRNDPVRLRAYLVEFPKGGELHSHTSGAVYAEDYLHWAVDQKLCVAPETLQLSNAPCSNATLPADKAFANATLYSRMIDYFSNRNFNSSRAMWGHDNFFATFDRFDLVTDNNAGKMLAKIQREAGRTNAVYLELMKSYFPPELWKAATTAGWDGNADATLARLRQTGVFDTIPATRKRISDVEAKAAALVAGTSGANVTVRWLEQCIRSLPPQYVFAQFAYAFALCQADPRVVGFNLVAPEDNPVSMRDYSLHMDMIQALRKHFPATNVSLHAGELRLGLVEPEGLRFHIREAVAVAGSKRIGHGVDLPFEKDMPGLLKEMKERGVSVEICLSSNDQILGVTGKDHPVRTYMAAGIPITLNTDDAGVARIDLPHEYQKAVQEQGFGFDDLVRASRNVLEYSFLPGQSLWQNATTFTPVNSCADGLKYGTPSSQCKALLAKSRKADLQWKLEQRFRAFDQRAPKFAR